jgi:Nif-specific regulatory protein
MKAIEQVTLFYEISNALNEHLDLKKSMYKVLDILSNSMQMERGTISILNPLRNEINIEVAHSLSKSAMERVKYKLGEGIIGRVIETGEAVAIPKISEEPLFLNRTASRRIKGMGEVSFICVPVQKGKRVVGALSVDRAFDPDYPLEEGTKLLSVVATMLARHAINLETIHLEKEALRAENKRLRDELENKYRINNIIGNSNKMREVFQMISQVSRSNATVLIRGESGTGKELVANSIHYNSTRSKGPFVKVNCAAIPNNLIESELFGHEKGAFTGAVKQKPGRFELAHKGTIFLDEIGSIEPDVQVRLLRVLQEREFERVGGHKTIKVDVRIIAATNKNLEMAVEEDSFRGDLYYRLNVFPIYMPPCGNAKRISCCWRTFFWSVTRMRTIGRSNGFPHRPSTCSWPTTGPAMYVSWKIASSEPFCFARKAPSTATTCRPPFKRARRAARCRISPWKMPWRHWKRK